MTPFDTQTIRANLKAQIEELEQTEPSLDIAYLVRWLRRKLEFYNSPHYPEYKAANEARRFDEELL